MANAATVEISNAASEASADLASTSYGYGNYGFGSSYYGDYYGYGSYNPWDWTQTSYGGYTEMQSTSFGTETTSTGSETTSTGSETSQASDDVAAVPLPATGMMLVAAFAGLGALTRRRRS